MSDAFSDWLKMVYSKHFGSVLRSGIPNVSSIGAGENEKRRREGFSASSLAPVSNPSDDVTPNGMARVNESPNDTTSGDAASDNAIPDDTTSGDTNPDCTNPDDTNSGDTNSDLPFNNAEPDNTTPDNMEPDNTTPDDTEADDTTPNDTEPNDTTPNDTTPNDTEPNDTEPDSATPNDVEPNSATSDDLTSATPEESTPTTSNEDSVITQSPAAQNGATPLTHSVPAPVPTTTSATAAHPFEHDQSYPGFITPAVIEYLNSVGGGLHWVEMVKKYLILEGQYRSRVSCCPFVDPSHLINTTQRSGRLSLQHRPEEVVFWARHRDLLPSITNVQEFGEKWITWWGNCQPKWRSTDTWPYPRSDAKDKDWARLNVTGTSGLFAIIMSTSWWAASVGLGSHCAVFDSAVEDLRWVIENLDHFNSQLPVARAGQVDASEADHFPGHGARDPGKRKIKPTPKVSNRT